MAYLKVRVVPKAHEDAVESWHGDALKVRVKAPPERGKANQAVCDLLAKRLNVPASAISLRRGAASRDKLLHIDGLTEEEMRRRLGAPMV